MSKKNKRGFEQASSPASSGAGHAAEYRIIKGDLVRVVVLNAIYLAAVLAIYFTNLKHPYLESWFSKILHF